MVGVVIVSHSRPLAEAMVALVRQMAPPEVRLAIAAGAGEERRELGTDAAEIAEAIQSVDGLDGVAVLLDLGSAILSAETALDLLPEEVRGRARLCAAPLVEGALVAAVQAGLGSDLETVCREAGRALEPKQHQLLPLPIPLPLAEEAVSAHAERGPAHQAEAIVALINPHGLHARPAARFVQMAAQYQADVRVRKAGAAAFTPVSGRSLNQLATLGAVQGDAIIISAQGPQADSAVAALRALVEGGFGESGAGVAPGVVFVGEAASVDQSPPGALRGSALSEGIAIGPLHHYHRGVPAVPDVEPADAAGERRRLDEALAQVRRAIDERRRQVSASLGDRHAAIFDAHRLILEDAAVLDRAGQLIVEQRFNAARAWQVTADEVAEAYRALPDAYLRQRAHDVTDVGAQVLSVLLGADAIRAAPLPGPVVLLADDLTPTQVAELDASKVLGLILLAGSATSHSAILMRALGIPAVSGVDASIESLPDGARVAVDGFRGAIWVAPEPAVVDELERRKAAWQTQQEELRRSGRQLTATRDGRRVEVAANLGGVFDARAAVLNGAEAVGVLRTEFLYLTRTEPPGEDEQVDALLQIGLALRPRPVIVRTLDVGGDKAIPYLKMGAEANPFLGLRAVRLSLRETALFEVQLRAILRAAAEYELRVLVPMVSVVEEIDLVQERLRKAHEALASAGLPHRWPISLGIMVETPSAALLADAMARRVDFLSIGTNDLTQYTLAVERGNPDLAALADSLHPAVLHLVKGVADAARKHGKWSGVCGEIASDEAAVPVLVGLGVDELSLNPASIPRVKAVIRALDMPSATALAERALQAESAGDVRRMAHEFLRSLETHNGSIRS